MSLSSALIVACAVCAAGDPTLRPAGTESAFASRVRAFVDLRAGRARAADVSLLDRRGEVGVTWAPSDDLTLTLGVPALTRSVAVEGRAASRVEETSLGDLEGRATAVIASSPRARWSFVGGAKAPTAPIARDALGRLLPSVLQPGCSSVVPFAGVGWTWREGPWSADASATFYLPFAVREAPHAGDSLRAGVGAQLQPARSRVASRLGVAARADSGGETSPGVADPDSGGVVVYVTPGLVASPAPDLVLSASAYVPVVQAFAGRHREGTIFALSTAYDF